MVSTKGRYGLRVMLDLAEHQDEGFIALKDIAARQEISKKYLEIIIKKLLEAGMVHSHSGKGGGYCLTKQPDAYSIEEILECMEETLAPVACLKEGAPACGREAGCQTLPLWAEYDALVRGFFRSKKLSDLL